MQYKIAFLLPNFESQGGVTVSVRTIANYLAKLGHEVHLFPVGETEVLASKYIHPINSNKKREQLKLGKKLYHAQTLQKSFDLTISNHFPSNYILQHLDTKEKHLIILRQPSLLKKRNIFSRFKKRIFFPKMYNKKNIVMISNCLLKDFLNRFSYLKPLSSRVIYNAFDAVLLEEKSQERINLPTNKEYIISVGRFTKTKNHSMLIKAFNHIKNKNIDLILLGEGKEEKSLRHLIKQYRLSDKIHFIGWKKNPYPYIKQAKLLVHTSKAETFGRVILEGLALHTPVISTDIKCGPNEMLTKELSEFLVPINSTTILTSTINKALISYPAITADKYLSEFNINKIAQQYLQFIQEGTK